MLSGISLASGLPPVRLVNLGSIRPKADLSRGVAEKSFAIGRLTGYSLARLRPRTPASQGFSLLHAAVHGGSLQLSVIRQVGGFGVDKG